MDDHPDLVARTVREFVASVASIDEPVPAGGSVAALTGAASAALLALVCGVLDRKGVDGVSELLGRAQQLQARLLALVDGDAAAFRSFLDARRDAGEQHVLQAALERTSQTPVEIARGCIDVVNLSQDVEHHTRGPMLSDVRTVRRLAGAAMAAALDIAEQNVALHSDDPAAQARLRSEIARLR
jgi:formiminotetrahydrofolate cyclodeaminase